MGYVATIILVVGWYCSGGTVDSLLISAALFAIAGAISFHN
jgi:hypothetical protein|nr:MAG TPA: hypothetical protein [Caudoviricetes sp.]